MNQFLNTLTLGYRHCHASNCRVLVAVSGGADSTALLRGTLQLRNDLNLDVTAAHLNHMLRGPESESDAAWLTELSSWLGVTLVDHCEDVAQAARRTGRGIEEMAREARYRFLEHAARQAKASHVVVAHTADDQAETILHHVLRGTGIAGLGGMRPVRGLADGILLARPMLEIDRRQVELFLAEIGQDSRHDATNDDATFTRSRIRHQLLPRLKRDFNPQIAQALRRLGRQAAELDEAVATMADRLLEQAVLEKQPLVCRLDCRQLAGHPRHLVRTCFARLWGELSWPRQRMGYAEWDRLADLVFDGGATTLPGRVEARRRSDLLILRCPG